jgi:hypothetical protein
VIADDEAFLAAHPTRRSNSEAIAHRREFKEASRRSKVLAQRLRRRKQVARALHQDRQPFGDDVKLLGLWQVRKYPSPSHADVVRLLRFRHLFKPVKRADACVSGNTAIERRYYPGMSNFKSMQMESLEVMGGGYTKNP